MRRKRPDLAGIPVELRAFTADDWPGKDRAASFEQWRLAVFAWSAEHRDVMTPLDALFLVRAARPK